MSHEEAEEQILSELFEKAAARIEELEAENKGLASLLNRLQSEVLQREESITNYKSLVESLDKYVGLLDDKIKTMTRIAYVHGWRSNLVDKEVAIRELIDRAHKLLETPTK